MQELTAHLSALARELSRLQGVALEGKAAVSAAFSKVLAASMLYPGEGDTPFEPGRNTDLILRGIHPDVQVVAGEKAGSISVDAVRALQREAHIKPNQAPGRVFILQDAAAMTPQAQNALLKIIEVPPAGVRFIFTMENRHNLLPTVQSRLVIVPISAQADNLPAHFPEAAQQITQMIGDWAKVVELLGEKAAIQLFSDCQSAYEAIMRGDAYRLMVLFSAHEKKREDFIQFCLCLRGVCGHYLLEGGGRIVRLHRAAECLAEAADRAGRNVFLPIVGSYTAGQIMA